MLYFVQPLIVIAAAVLIIRGVVAWRAGASTTSIIAGVALLVAFVALPHVPWGHILPLVFVVSVAGATVAQVLKALGRVESIPRRGLAWAYGDWMIVSLTAPGYAKFAGAIWSLGVATWAISSVVNHVVQPVLDARRREADAEIARMQAAQRDAYDGEV